MKLAWQRTGKATQRRRCIFRIAVRVFEENGALKMWVSDQDETRRLLSQGDHVFLAENTPDFVLTFVVDDGRATGFNVRKADPGLIVAVRIH